MFEYLEILFSVVVMLAIASGLAFVVHTLDGTKFNGKFYYKDWLPW